MSQPPRQGLPGWTIALIIGSVLLIVLPVVTLAIAGFSAYRVFNPAAASDTPPEPDFDGFDVCSLITPRDAERAGARSDRFGPEEVTVVGRVVYTEQGVPFDTCEYDTEPTERANVLVAVSPGPVIDETFLEYPADQRIPLTGVGSQAYQVTDYQTGEATVVGRRGATQFAISAYSSGEREQMKEHQRTVVELARKIAGAVPAKLTLPGRVASGPCAEADAKALAAGLGGPVAYSRSHELKGATVCSYASANGRTVNARLRKSADDIAVKRATSNKPVQVGGWTGYQAREVVTIVEDRKLLEVDFYYSVDESADLAATDHALAGAVADALLDK